VKSLWLTPACGSRNCFLSGGQEAELASAALNCDESAFSRRNCSLSFVCPRHSTAGLGLVGQEANVKAAQEALRIAPLLQPGLRAVGIHWRDGKGISMTTLVKRASDLAGEKPSFHQDESR